MRLLSFQDLLDRPRPTADRRVAYGAGPQQFGELWLPKGERPYSTVVVIHGGCWLADLPGLELMDHMCGALRDEGLAVWNLEYRRIGHNGGGFPGTFEDVAQGAEYLGSLAPQHGLDLDRLVALGHSAGGHLAVWLAARHRPIRGVISLAGIVDLEAYRSRGPDACGGPPTIDALVGSGRPGDVFADTSPRKLLPLGVRQVIVSGELDPIVPPIFGHDFAAAAIHSGDQATDLEIIGAGHFELIDPLSGAWPEIRFAVLNLISGSS